MSHYKLKANIDGSEVIAESLELTGSKAFKVFPDSRNETQAPIRGSAVVSILGKNHSIQLNHKVKTYEDPEPSTTKWSYIKNLYIDGSTPVPASDEKNQDTGYVRASRGKTTYGTVNDTPTQTIIVSDGFINYTALMNKVGDFSSNPGGTTYSKGAIMTLFTFAMYYKYSTEQGGQVIPPVDDGTPASNKARIPCRPDFSAAPDWFKNASIIYKVDYTTSSGSDSITYDNWPDFIAFWDSICTNPSYTDATFEYLFKGTFEFNESLNQRGSNTVTISEIDNGKGVGIHGAKPLYFAISQQEGRTIYGVSLVPANANMLDSQGMWGFDDLSIHEIYNNKLGRYSADLYTYIPKFKIKSSTSGYARGISVITGGSVITNPDGAGTFEYQYIGQPFILKLFKETANGIEKNYFRPYYKPTESTGQNSTEFWKDSIQLLGSQNFNPLIYDGYNEFYYLHVRKSSEGAGFRGFLSGPMSGDYGLCALQLIPICIYAWGTGQYTCRDYIDGEGGVGTKGVNYVNRYNRYESAIGSADTDRTGPSTDKYKAAFLKWPNEDDNNAPDHICPTGVIESVLSQMGKNWENWVQNNGNYKYLDRVMLVPVLWTQIRLEESSGFRTFLNSQGRFGNYLFSPWISDSEIDNNSEAVQGIHVGGCDIQIQ